MPGPSLSTWRAFGGRYVIALVVALLFTATGVAAVNREIDHRVDAIKRIDVLVPEAPPEGANYLLIGSDTRAGLTAPEDIGAFGDPSVENGVNSDTMMVAHLEPGAQHALVVSFPRDLKVEVPDEPGHYAKINSFYGSDGPQGVINMLKWNFDVDINHYVEVDFETFGKVVDAIGTVNVFFRYPTRDEKTGLFVDKGPVCQALDGAQALEYVRSRSPEVLINGNWLPQGTDLPDIHRIERQQAFIRKLTAVAISTSLGDPIKAINIADNALHDMTLDEGVGRDEVNQLIRAFKNVDVNDPGAVQFETLPIVVDPATNNSYLLPDGDNAQEMIDRLRSFGNFAAPPLSVAPSQVKVRVIEAFVGQTGRSLGVTQELVKYGFVAKVGTDARNGLFPSEIHYPPSMVAEAKLLGLTVPDAALKADTTLTDHLELRLGVTFAGLVPPVATTPAPAPAASSSTTTTTLAPTTTTALPTTTVDPLEAACQ